MIPSTNSASEINQRVELPFVWQKNEPVNRPLTEVFQSEIATIQALLLQHGAILFKGYGIDHPERLAQCVAAFPGQSIDYTGGNSPRTNLQGHVYTSTEHPAHTHISLHNELSYAHAWPSYLFFCCQQPAAQGGDTIIADSRAILTYLSASTRAIFEEKGVLYIRNLHGGKGAGPSWQATFETEDQALVEAHCRANDISFTWTDRQHLRLEEKRPAIVQHPHTDEAVWFNQADQFHPSTNESEVYEALMEIYEDDPTQMPQYVCFGDGTGIPNELLDEVRQAGAAQTRRFDWEQGDLLLLDNVLTAHGRTPFQGPRSILVAMLS